MNVGAIIDELLVSGEDDWVPLVALVRKLDSNRSGEDLLQAVLAVVQGALASGWMIAGEVREAGFVPWPLAVRDALARIEHEWRALGRTPELGDICWLSNTPEGDKRTRRVASAGKGHGRG